MEASGKRRKHQCFFRKNSSRGSKLVQVLPASSFWLLSKDIAAECSRSLLWIRYLNTESICRYKLQVFCKWARWHTPCFDVESNTARCWHIKKLVQLQLSRKGQVSIPCWIHDQLIGYFQYTGASPICSHNNSQSRASCVLLEIVDLVHMAHCI